jgi:hypothetical protein
MPYEHCCRARPEVQVSRGEWHILTRDLCGFNKSLSTVWIAVENAFVIVQQLWTYTAFGKGLSAGKQPVGAISAVAVLLTTVTLAYIAIRSHNDLECLCHLWRIIFI